MSEKGIDLPHPWTAVLDPESGDTYYWNEETDEVSWIPPGPDGAVPEVTSDEEGNDDTFAGIPEGMMLAPGWEEVIDDDSGDVYYWNTATDETTWTPPVVPIPQQQASTKQSPPQTAAAPAATAVAAPAIPETASAESDQEDQPAVATPKPRAGRKHRGVIMAESYDAATEPFELRRIPKSEPSKAVIREVLAASQFIFSGLSPAELEDLVLSMEERQVKAGEVIIQQGDHGDNFYIVESGQFDIFVNDNKVASRGAKSSFGEVALLYNSPRNATVKATENSLVWALDRKTFRHMIASTMEDKFGQIVEALRKVKLLESLDDSELNQVAQAVKIETFHPDEVIIRKGDEGNTFYMVKEGSVVCTGAGSGGATHQDLQIEAGGYFGERALLMSAPRAANVIAKEETTCMVLDREPFERLLGPLHALIDKKLGRRVLGTIPVLQILSEKERDLVVERFQTISFSNKDQILQRGETNNCFFVVKKGVVKLIKAAGDDSGYQFTAGAKKPKTDTLAAGGCFGEKALSGPDVSEYDVVAVGNVDCFKLHRSEFEAAVGPLSSILGRKSAPQTAHSGVSASESAASPSSASAEMASPVSQRLRSDIKFEQLEVMTALGSGTFGTVKLVKHKPTGRAYALKVLSKSRVVAYKQQTNVINEKNIMAELDHPFILRLEASFKDDQNLYLLMELVQGGELFNLLASQPSGRLSSSHARFYGACVVDALAYMHSKSILYRDLKPENMLLDAEGYIKIVDMGFAKKVKDRTYTLCGTPEYLAPELVLGRGHNKGVDYWATGVLIYEMLVGVSPFADPAGGDQMVICRNIVKKELTFPSFMKDSDAKDLISRLLRKPLLTRLGCGQHGADAIKAHKWFAKIQWDTLTSKKLHAPWVPPLKDPFDTSHFDAPEEMDDIEPYVDDGSNWDADF